MVYYIGLLRTKVNNVIWTCISCILFASTIVSGIAYAQTDNPSVFPTDSSPFGIPYETYTAEWWQNNVNYTANEHPRDNFRPEKCDLGNNGPIWFLPDILNGNEERTCMVPEGKAVLIPIITGICWNDGNPNFYTDDELLSCAKEGQQEAFINAYVNGVKLEDILDNEISSPYFNLTIPSDSYVRYYEDPNGGVAECMECPVGTFRAIADGYYIFLEPLDEGSYEIKFSYDTLNNPISDYRTAASLVYNLIVEPS
jgi:hypothetical protein